MSPHVEKSTALLIVDMQVGCFAGTPPRHDAEGVVARINSLSSALRGRCPVIFVQHTDPAEGLARDSEAWNILPSLIVADTDLKVEKEGCDSFLETPLKAMLEERGVKNLIVVGCATDFCVDTTVRSGAGLGFDIIVASDAHTTRNRPHCDAVTLIKHHNYVWADFLLPRGRKIRVLPTADLLKELA